MICVHSYFPQHEPLEFCRKERIHLMAHQPLGGKPIGVVAPHSDIPGPFLDKKVALNEYVGAMA